jgi:hypothetical protein
VSTIEGAIVEEQGVTFAVAIVRAAVLSSPSQRDEAVVEFSAVFDGLPTILMAQDGQGRRTYYGRNDLVDFMASVPLEAVPWSRFDVR